MHINESEIKRELAIIRTHNQHLYEQLIALKEHVLKMGCTGLAVLAKEKCLLDFLKKEVLAYVHLRGSFPDTYHWTQNIEEEILEMMQHYHECASPWASFFEKIEETKETLALLAEAEQWFEAFDNKQALVSDDVDEQLSELSYTPQSTHEQFPAKSHASLAGNKTHPVTTKELQKHDLSYQYHHAHDLNHALYAQVKHLLLHSTHVHGLLAALHKHNGQLHTNITHIQVHFRQHRQELGAYHKPINHILNHIQLEMTHLQLELQLAYAEKHSVHVSNHFAHYYEPTHRLDREHGTHHAYEYFHPHQTYHERSYKTVHEEYDEARKRYLDRNFVK